MCDSVCSVVCYDIISMPIYNYLGHMCVSFIVELTYMFKMIITLTLGVDILIIAY